MLPTFGGRCNRYFSDIWPKILRLPNFNILLQLVLTKFFKSELFSCLPKVDQVIKSCKEPLTSQCWIPVNAHAPIKDGTVVSHYCVFMWLSKND